MDIDGINQTVVYIPYARPDNDSDEEATPVHSYSPYKERDLVDGYALRMKAYRTAWTKCLDRLQAVIKGLHTPVADAVVQHIRHAYSNTLPGLPYPELPVTTLTSPTVGTSVLNDITDKLTRSHSDNVDDDMSDSSQQETRDAYVTHLYPAECTNIMVTMKALIGGFIRRIPGGRDAQIKRKPTTSVASYDIELLVAWYEAIREMRDGDSDTLPQLIVLLCDFEQFDTAVVQDMFYICSLHIRRLPFVFILSLSSPPSPSFLHLTYSRSTLALLRIRNFILPSPSQVLEEILSKLFFDVEFEPDIIMGPTVLGFLVEHFTRHHPSVDSVLTILQLAHMKHFEEPLTVFVHDTLLGTVRRDRAVDLLLKPESFAFLDSVFARLEKPNPIPSVGKLPQWRTRDVPAVLDSIDDAHLGLKSRARRMRVAFKLMRTVQQFMRRQGYRSADFEQSFPEMMVAATRGKLGRDGKYLATMVKKVSNPQLADLLDELHSFFQKMPSQVWQEEDEAISKVIAWMSALPVDRSVSVVQLAKDVGEWLTDYFRDRLSHLEESKLWDIWYTGFSPFPSELINPSIRASIISGLLHPNSYVDYDPSRLPSDNEDDERARPALWELPDTSILFRRYLDSGKTINVYDWFESFAVVLENQRRHLKKRGEEAGSSSPRKSGTSPSKGKGKQRKVDVSDEEDVRMEDASDGGDDGEDEDKEEKWKMEIQARFMRALHELDYLGFIKHTGRKADHVNRTIFDIPD